MQGRSNVPRLLAVLAANGFALAQLLSLDLEFMKLGARNYPTGFLLISIISFTGIAAAYLGLIFEGSDGIQRWSYIPEIIAAFCFTYTVWIWLGHVGS